MSGEKADISSNIQGEIQSHKVAAVEYPPSYNDATHYNNHPPGGMNNPMPGPPGSYYPNLPPPGSDIQMQPMSGSGPYPHPGYSSAPNYGPYPPPMTSQPPPLGFANPHQQPPPGMMPNPYQQPPPGMMPDPHQQPPPGMMPPPNHAGGEYNYPKTYVVVPPGDQNQQRTDSDGMECCKCLLCCCGCIELCRCFGMCLKCICDTD